MLVLNSPNLAAGALPLPPVITTHTFTLVFVRERTYSFACVFGLSALPAHATAVYEMIPEAQFTLALPSAW